jgi:hypothetical protein
MGISLLARSRPQSESFSSLDRHFQACLDLLSVRGFPLVEYMYPEITNNGDLEVIFGLHALQNDCPRHPQIFQSQIPLAWYKWYSSRWIKLRFSGFIEGYTVAADLMT